VKTIHIITGRTGGAQQFFDSSIAKNNETLHMLNSIIADYPGRLNNVITALHPRAHYNSNSICYTTWARYALWLFHMMIIIISSPLQFSQSVVHHSFQRNHYIFHLGESICLTVGQSPMASRTQQQLTKIEKSERHVRRVPCIIRMSSSKHLYYKIIISIEKTNNVSLILRYGIDGVTYNWANSTLKTWLVQHF